VKRSKAAPEATADRKPAFTSRAAVLAVVVAALAIALAAPVRHLLSQHAQITSLRGSVESEKKQVADLQKRQAQLADPSYVAAQARDRLHYVRPGEVPFVTLSPTPAGQASAQAAAALANQPWYGRLWSSVKVAGAVPKPSPTLASALASAIASTPTPAPAPAASPIPSVSPTPAVSPTPEVVPFRGP
jgi:cell division protein FtsB